MAHVLMLNPRNKQGQFVKGGYARNAKPKKPTKRKAKAARRGHVVRGPAGAIGKAVVINLGKREGLRTAPKGTYTVNPKKSKSKKYHAKKKSSGKRPSYRRNPMGGMVPFMMDSFTPAIAFPAAALANDVLYGLIPLPAMFRAGMWRPVGKLGLAAVLGIAASFVLPRRMAVLAAGGMIGGVLYETGKGWLQTTFPTLPLAGIEQYPLMEYENMAGDQPDFLGADTPDFLGEDIGPLTTGAYVENSMGAYTQNAGNGNE